MTDNIAHLPTSDAAIRALHAEIERLASHASTAYVNHAPIAIAHSGTGDEMVMFYDADQIKVFTCDGIVFISGIEHFGYWPDWFCLGNKQARAVAQALLSAASSLPDETPQPATREDHP